MAEQRAVEEQSAEQRVRAVYPDAWQESRLHGIWKNKKLRDLWRNTYDFSKEKALEQEGLLGVTWQDAASRLPRTTAYTPGERQAKADLPAHPEGAEAGEQDEAKWATSKQRNDLKRCPFCNTHAIEQVKLWRTADRFSYRISCGNPFCDLECRTNSFHSLHYAEEAWQTRA